jgi:hypothetical protein
MSVVLMAHAVFAVGAVVRKETQNRVGSTRYVAVVFTGKEHDALAGREGVGLHGWFSRDVFDPRRDQATGQPARPVVIRAASDVEDNPVDLVGRQI